MALSAHDPEYLVFFHIRSFSYKSTNCGRSRYLIEPSEQNFAVDIMSDIIVTQPQPESPFRATPLDTRLCNIYLSRPLNLGSGGSLLRREKVGILQGINAWL